MDFKSLYLSMLFESIVIEIRNLLINNSIRILSKFKFLSDTINIANKNSYLNLGDTYYTRKRECPMGSPLAGPMAEIQLKKKLSANTERTSYFTPDIETIFSSY